MSRVALLWHFLMVSSSLSWAVAASVNFLEMEYILQVTKSQREPFCNIWITGNWSDNEADLAYLTEAAERPVIIAEQEMIRHMSSGCLLMVAWFASIDQLGDYLEGQESDLGGGKYNSDHKFVWPAAQFIMVQNEDGVTSSLQTFRYLTHFIRRLDQFTVEVLTFCPGKRYSELNLSNTWHVQEGLLIPNLVSCPHVLSGRRQRVSIMGLLPYVKPGEHPHGSDIDLMRIISDKLRFTLEIKSETSYKNIFEAVSVLTKGSLASMVMPATNPVILIQGGEPHLPVRPWSGGGHL